ncbi:MAG: shikimate kinase [Armatimonadetes bacterium]|nr:shikimate kinase [Armatimonadota bacterium]
MQPSSNEPISSCHSKARAWVLVGMMGAGKSTVGRQLAELSGRKFVDLDSLLQLRFGRPVHQIFSVYGEEAFRGHETSLLRSLEPEPIVLATGGGVVLREENWIEMRRLGLVLYLRTDVDTLKERLTQSKRRRPLLEVADWEARLAALVTQRSEFYERADGVLEIGERTLEETAQEAFALLTAMEGQT